MNCQYFCGQFFNIEFHLTLETGQYVADVGGALNKCGWKRFIDFSLLLESFLERLGEETFKEVFVILSKVCLLKPTLDIKDPGKIVEGEVNHTASTNRSWRGDCKVLDLEEHSQLGPQLDSFTVCQTESHVVVEHSVHVFNPQCINRAVKDHPISIIGVPFRVFHIGVVDSSDDRTGQAVNPLLSERVDLPIHLSHADRLWIQNFVVCFFESFFPHRFHGS
jgi:hypothetical protein